MSDTDLAFALTFPEATLLKYIFNKLSLTDKELMETKFQENFVLRERMEGMKMIVEEKHIQSPEQYEEFQRKGSSGNKLNK